ncbi:YdeI/OmpD-associated family protein [Arachidicoccus terrestris]|uniref:YdeI/OmpD-associated family protein n=1 Tax=Arachidicoccus terrestris TaxID=2875539 RepID=UPI001CC6E347|nr:YdeI/OmpD-associated family protein [Arachidicoccus terrestris]UAY55079.1 YdeI/OmpD-associated family protein [Arachidicoccus terrestris]
MQNSKKWTEELEILAIIISKHPLEKTIKWGAEVFTYNGRNVVSYGGFKHHFTLWFYNGVFLKDKYQVLINAQEGKTKSLRQWRFTSKGEINETKISAYIKEAIEIEKKGLKIQPEKFKPLPIPGLLLNELKKNKVLKAGFEMLTPGKQKEYIMYINDAKLEQTKLKRLEKIKPMIEEGKGLNDKYK